MSVPGWHFETHRRCDHHDLHRRGAALNHGITPYIRHWITHACVEGQPRHQAHGSSHPPNSEDVCVKLNSSLGARWEPPPLLLLLPLPPLPPPLLLPSVLTKNGFPLPLVSNWSCWGGAGAAAAIFECVCHPEMIPCASLSKQDIHSETNDEPTLSPRPPAWGRPRSGSAAACSAPAPAASTTPPNLTPPTHLLSTSLPQPNHDEAHQDNYHRDTNDKPTLFKRPPAWGRPC